MFLDDDKVSVGDRVYHITAGYGIVETINEKGNQARVRMSSGGILDMRDGGFTGLRKTFYWYKPHMLVPRKGMADVHAKAIQIAEKVMEML